MNRLWLNGPENVLPSQTRPKMTIYGPCWAVSTNRNEAKPTLAHFDSSRSFSHGPLSWSLPSLPLLLALSALLNPTTMPTLAAAAAAARRAGGALRYAVLGGVRSLSSLQPSSSSSAAAAASEEVTQRFWFRRRLAASDSDRRCEVLWLTSRVSAGAGGRQGQRARRRAQPPRPSQRAHDHHGSYAFSCSIKCVRGIR